MDKKYYIGVDIANGPDVSADILVKKVGDHFEYLNVVKHDIFKKCYGSNCPFRDKCIKYAEKPVGYISYVDYQYVEGKGCEYFKEIELKK